MAEEMAAAANDSGRSCRRRNVLDLANRIQVIREFTALDAKNLTSTRKCLYLAEKYQCSVKQIKNIISQKEEILRTYYGSIFSPSMRMATTQSRLQLSGSDGDLFGGQEYYYASATHLTRTEKIHLLPKIMYEYLQRVLYQGQPINESIFRLKSLEFKESLPIENFKLNQLWFENFKKTYDIVDFDLTHIRNNLSHFKELQRQQQQQEGLLHEQELERLSLNTADIISHVIQLDREEQSKKAISKQQQQQQEQYREQYQWQYKGLQQQQQQQQQQSNLNLQVLNGSICSCPTCSISTNKTIINLKSTKASTASSFGALATPAVSLPTFATLAAAAVSSSVVVSSPALMSSSDLRTLPVFGTSQALISSSAFAASLRPISALLYTSDVVPSSTLLSTSALPSSAALAPSPAFAAPAEPISPLLSSSTLISSSVLAASPVVMSVPAFTAPAEPISPLLSSSTLISSSVSAASPVVMSVPAFTAPAKPISPLLSSSTLMSSTALPSSAALAPSSAFATPAEPISPLLSSSTLMSSSVSAASSAEMSVLAFMAPTEPTLALVSSSTLRSAPETPSPSSAREEELRSKCNFSPFPDIKDIYGVLDHIKTLEMYAMLKDNYHAIAVLSRLEQIFIEHAVENQ